MGIELQVLLVGLLVAGCSVYAVWALMPQALRRVLARALLRWYWPAPVKAFLTQTALTNGGCHCAGCEHASGRPGQADKPGLPRSQVMLFQPRQKRQVP